MEEKKTQNYFYNIPIPLLKGFMKDPTKGMYNITCYVIFMLSVQRRMGLDKTPTNAQMKEVIAYLDKGWEYMPYEDDYSDKYFSYYIELHWIQGYTEFFKDDEQAWLNCMELQKTAAAIWRSRLRRYGNRARNPIPFSLQIKANITEQYFHHGYFLAKEVHKGNTQPPLVGITKKQIAEFTLHYHSDFDYYCLLAHLAIRSIIGAAKQKKITNDYIFARMDGKIKNDGKLSEEIQAIANRYHFEQIRLELFSFWGLSFYSHHTRGCYYSYKLPLRELAKNANDTKIGARVRKQKREYINKLYGISDDDE